MSLASLHKKLEWNSSRNDQVPQEDVDSRLGDYGDKIRNRYINPKSDSSKLLEEYITQTKSAQMVSQRLNNAFDQCVKELYV